MSQLRRTYCLSPHMWECTNISHHDKNIYKEGIFLNSEGTCHPLSPVIYENLRGNDEVNFGKKKNKDSWKFGLSL